MISVVFELNHELTAAEDRFVWTAVLTGGAAFPLMIELIVFVTPI